jgi:hypothetical protein
MALFKNLLPARQPTPLINPLRYGIIPKPRGLVLESFHGRFHCSGAQINDAIATKLSHQQQRRSGNYQPPYWDNELLQSHKNEYAVIFYLCLIG